MDDTNQNKCITCLFCHGQFLHPGPKYSLHLFQCHGVVVDSHRDYLVKASEFRMETGQLPDLRLPAPASEERDQLGLEPVWSVEIEIISGDDDENNGFLQPEDGIMSTMEKEEIQMKLKVECVGCGKFYASKDSLRVHRKICKGRHHHPPGQGNIFNYDYDDKQKDPDYSKSKKKVKCIDCGKFYASKDSLYKHRKKICHKYSGRLTM